MVRTQDRSVTFAAISDTVKEVEGVTISTNTIQRNDLAYTIYQHYASTGRPDAIGIHRSPSSWTAPCRRAWAAPDQGLHAYGGLRRTS